MIRFKVSFIALAFVLFSCSKPASSIASKAVPGCYTGKLVKKGICGQYVIELQSSDKESLEIAAMWNDPSSATNYQNVFTVANPCDFPANIKQGEAFTFTIAGQEINTCALCEAFTPTPAAKNLITVGCKIN